jgi:hypothetical protein
MKPLIAAAICICAVIASASAESEHSNRSRPPKVPLPQFGPDHLSHGLGIVWVGAMTHPVLSVFYVTEHHKLPAAALFRYVHLNDREYESLLRFTRSTPCSREQVNSKPPYPGSISIQEFSKHGVRELCVFPMKGGCEYLLGVARLPGIDWSHKDTFPLFQFEAELGCKEPWTQPHDADGRPN